jgi:hypothetical protein
MLKTGAKNKIDLIEIHRKEQEQTPKSKNDKYLVNNGSTDNDKLLEDILDNFPERILG